MRAHFSILILTIFCHNVYAQLIPNAGQSIREIEQQPLELPHQEKIELNLPDIPAANSKTDGPTLKVAGFIFSGNIAISSRELAEQVKSLNSRTLSLGELQSAANQITLLYRSRGYPLARAYLPAQEVENGIVEIAVLEGTYGRINVEGSASLKGSALAPLDQLKRGAPVKGDLLERSLLLLNDTPGVEVKSTLKPGATVGATDLLIELKSSATVTGSIDMDNYGNRFTGQNRLGGTVNVNNSLGLGDRISLRALGSDEDQHYYRIGYQLPIGPWSTQVGVAYSDMDYELAKDFSDIKAHGTARIVSIFAIQPIVRGRDFSLYGQLQFDDKSLNDDIDLFTNKSDKQSRVWTAVLNGNSRDELFGGGVNSFSLSWSHGDLDINGTRNQLIDDLTARTRGQFNKLNPSFLRLQRLTDRFSLYTQVQAQISDTNLDSSEKMSLGGAYGVRAYPQGEANGDEGWQANVELRYALSQAWQLSTFVDHGEVRLNKNTWVTGENHRSLSAAGIGASWSAYGWQINGVAAWKLGSAEPQSDVNRTPRVWAQIVHSF